MPSLKPEETQSPEPSYLIPEGPAKTVTFSLAWTKCASFFPITNTDPLNAQVIPLCYEGLFELTPDFEIKNVLCDSWKRVDSLTYSFTLRPDVTFHNGEKLTSADVVYSLQEATAPSSTHYNTLRKVDKAVAISELEVEVKLLSPMANLPAVLTFPILSEAAKNESFQSGTGVYQIASEIYDPEVVTEGSSEQEGNTISYFLKPFDNYWQEIAPPELRIDLIEIKNPEERAFFFQFGAISMLQMNEWDPLSTDIHSVCERYQALDSTLQFVAINPRTEPLKDPALRKAIAHVLDRQRITEQTYGNQAIVSQSISPIGNPSAVEYDFHAGELLLTGLNVKDDNSDNILDYVKDRVSYPLEFTMIVNSEDSAKLQGATMFADSLNAMGITVNTRNLSFELYQRAIIVGDYDFAWAQSRLSPDFDPSVFYSENGGLNLPRNSPSEKMSAALKYYSESAPVYRTGALRSVYDEAINESYILPVCFLKSTLLTAKGLFINPTPAGQNLYYNFKNWKRY